MQWGKSRVIIFVSNDIVRIYNVKLYPLTRRKGVYAVVSLRGADSGSRMDIGHIQLAHENIESIRKL